MHGCIWILVPLLLGGCSYLFPTKEDKKFTPKDLNLPEIHYRADLEVIGDKKEEPYFRSVPDLMQSTSSPPTSTNALRYRAETDLKLLRKALKNKGYFNGTVEYTLDHSGEEKRIKFKITPGTLYHVEGVVIEMTGNEEGPILPNKSLEDKVRKVVDINKGADVRLDDVVAALPRLNRYFVSHGYPDVEIEQPLGKINDDKRTVLLIYKIHLKGKKIYGPLTITGNKAVSTSYINHRFHIQEGEIYDQRDLDKSRRALLDSEIFSSVLISHKSTGDRADLLVEVTEAPPRRVVAGLRYGTQEGTGGKLLWEHKNAFGNGEDFYIKGEGGQRQFKASLGLSVPDVIWQDFTLSTVASLTRAKTKAYDGDIYTYYLGLEHHLDEQSAYGVGLEAERSNLHKTDRLKRTFAGVSAYYLYDGSNDKLNPYKGARLRVDVAPYFGNFVQHRPMVKINIFSTQYWRLIKKDTLVIATWERFGQVVGLPIADVPLNRRLYGGGTGSVRGYGFQKLNRPDALGNPQGGKAMVEFGIEPRWRFSKKVGVSVFWEGGVVSTNRFPGVKSKEFRSGYGIGGKYYTDIGPLRVDIAFPTKRRKVGGRRYDAPVQFYISLGQPF
jgi:translocation and assembly module TamA